jgi:protein O-mannosyl-transferase
MREVPVKSKVTLHFLVITVLVLGAYLPALNAGFLAMDDVSTMKVIHSGSLSIRSLFFSPGSDYYRPLTILSYLADFHLFGGNPAGYHLTNILLHLANALLVYYLAAALLGRDQSSPIYPLITALLFALHPINSEAVVWISARTDLLCCLFALICMTILIKRSTTMTPIVFMGLFLSCFFSLAAKESSLFLPLLAIVYLFLAGKNVSRKNAIAVCSALGIATIVYLLLRKGLPVTPTVAIETTTPTGNQLLPYFVDGAAALGFYLRKLLYPFPLNIAITEIPTNLCLIFFLLGGGSAAIIWKKVSSLRFPLAFLAVSFIPPLGVFFLSLAWTPYAERYLYIPSVALALCCGILIHRYREKVPHFIAVICIALLAIPTANRVNLWTKPISFWQDAVVNSPRFGTARLPLVTAYLEAGRYAEAERILRQADALGLPRKSARDFSHELWRLLNSRKALAPDNGTTSNESKSTSTTGRIVLCA